MPITAQPDPNNPGQWIWVDAATGQPATQPGGPGTPYVAPSDQAGGGVGPGPYGPTITPTQRAQQAAAVASQNPPTLGTPGAQGPNQIGPAGMYTVDQLTAQAASEVQQANLNVAATWEQIRQQQAVIDPLQGSTNPLDQQKLTAATATLNALYTTLSQAEQRVETANAAYSTSLTKAIDQNQVAPAQVQLAKAQADKADADSQSAAAQAKVLIEGAPGQRALVAAQAGQASAAAAAQQAAADATTAKTPAEVAQLQAQASALNAQANQTTALLPGLVARQQADISLTQSQASLTDTQSDYYKAQANKTNADAEYQRAVTGSLLPAQVGTTQAQAGLYGAQATGQLAQAAGTLAGIQQNLQGPLYGLQDRVNAIRAIQQQVFGPGGSGDPAEANDLLGQYVNASIAGTTPYAANVAAANAGLTQFGTQASMYDAAQQAMASRANAFAGAGANLFGTLAGMNVNAPAGSTALVGAFQDVMNNLQSRLGSSQFAPPSQPQAPALPKLLQQLAGMTGPTPPALPSGPVQPQTSAPVTINIGGQGQGQTQTAAPSFSPPPGGYAQNQPGTYGAFSGSMPAALQQYAPATSQSVHDLWSNELQSGVVKSPYDTMQQPIAAPTPAPVM